jgi:hypothetical protein
MARITKAQQAERDEARATLRGLLDQATDRTLYTILRHVSSSGMTRVIDVVVMLDNQPASLSHLYARAIGERTDKRGGVKMTGAGMDMGYALAYNVGRVAYPQGHRCDGETCHSNDHDNRPHPPRVAGSMTHTDGGYRFDHRWL